MKVDTKRLPSEWRIAQLGQLGEVNRGRSRHRPRYAQHLYGGPYPFIQTGDIKGSDGRITSYKQTYSEAGLAQSRLWPAGTMCITIAANIADTGILTFPACFPDSVVGFIPDGSQCDVRFMEYAFRYKKAQIQREASGSVQDNINLATLGQLSFELPPLSEQRAIANVLGGLDDKILLNREMSETLDALWMTYVARAIDLEPTRVSLTDLAIFVNGGAFTKDANGQGLPIVRIQELNGGIDADTPRSNLVVGPAQKADVGDLLFSWSGSLDVYRWHGPEVLINQHIFKVIPKPDIPQWAVYYGLRAAMAEFQGIARDKATTMGHIQRRHLDETRVELPVPALTALDTVVGPMYRLCRLNAQESMTLAALRDTLLPKLITGELRVSKANRLVKEAV